ncbi:MAG: hypothetical protein IJH61_07775, partial [Eubacteriaceae bacterium]|nr:hypothetical protein [Eubacteriaceae bacterium]
TTFKEVGAYEDYQFAHIDGGKSNPGYFTNIADKPVSSPSETASTGTGTDNADGTVTVQIPITKLMHMNAADATILNDYTFTMTPAEAVHTQDSYTGATSPAQTDNTVTIHKEAFNRITELNSNNNKVVISNVNNNNASGVDNDVFTLTFTNGQIGQFHYHVVETPITSGLQSGVTQDSTLYDIVVTIENKDPSNITSGEVKFAGVTMSTSTDNGDTWTKTNTGENTKSDRGGAGVDINNAKFTNTFHTADVLVDKTVRGSLGDKTKDFTFTFNVMGTGIPTTYKLYKTNAANETAEPVDVQNGSTFTLKHGESAKVMGLPEGAMYRIMEQGVVDYKTNINATLGDSDYNEYYTVNFHNGATYAFGMNGDAYSETAASTGGAGEDILVSTSSDALSMVDITAASNLDEQHFTNMKGQLIPTGLIENMASFLGLALLAAFAIGYMIYKKKKDTVSEEA